MKASAAYLENLTTYKMSDLLNQASLVMVPSGYKEDIVYSQIPTTGAGDLSFTRASNGTRVNSAGLVEVCPWNLVQNSEQYSAGTWGLAFLSISTDSAVAPNGTTTADLLYPPSSQAYCYVSTTSFSVVAGQTYTQSVYLKRSGFRWGIVDNMAGSPGAWFDLLNGVVGTVASGCTAFIESVGNGWYRCSVSSVAQAGTNYADFRMSDTNGGSAVTANGSDGLLAWGFQLNIGSTAKPYFPTTDRLNVPRLTYQNGGGGCPSLLLEKQSTNLVLHSEQFDNSGSWSYSECSVTANQAISPDGTQNADKLIESSANTIHEIYQGLTLTSGATYTNTIYAKSAERTQIAINFVSGGFGQGAQVIANLSNGTLGSVTNYGGVTGSSATIQNMGNGWYRISLTMTPVSTTTFYADYSPAVNGNAFYQGNGTSGVYIWGAQIEASSYATSYIGPTTSSSATRVADACYKTGISSLIGQSEGVIFADITPQIFNNSAYQTIAIIYPNAGLGGTYFHLYKNTGSTNLFFEVWNASSQCSMSYTMANNTRYKVAAGYKNNDFVLYVNGVQVGSDNTGTVASVTYSTLEMGYDSFNTDSQMSLSEFVLFKTRLTNAELVSLTTI